MLYEIFIFNYIHLACVIYPTRTKYSTIKCRNQLYLCQARYKNVINTSSELNLLSWVKHLKYIYIILGTVIILVIITLSIFLSPYLEKKQKQRDRSIGCLQYRQMLNESEKSYSINPNGKKWVRESMAAEGLRKDFGCTDINKK